MRILICYVCNVQNREKPVSPLFIFQSVRKVRSMKCQISRGSECAVPHTCTTQQKNRRSRSRRARGAGGRTWWRRARPSRLSLVTKSTCSHQRSLMLEVTEVIRGHLTGILYCEMGWALSLVSSFPLLQRPWRFVTSTKAWNWMSNKSEDSNLLRQHLRGKLSYLVIINAYKFIFHYNLDFFESINYI